MVRTATQNDIQAIVNIYNYYVINTAITFDETPFTFETIEDRINHADARHPWLVFEENNEVLGYAYAGIWKARSAFKNTVEVTVYLKDGHDGKGIGTDLYKELIKRLKENGMRSLLGGITLPNPGSEALHEKLGFKKVAHFTDFGFKFDKWHNAGYWELILNR
ncbi:MAG: N-acetyltransferase family protein [Flavobacteriales bacterium]|nr:N-acetyltransferase family protein [Flavobacteriales bacterium]